MNARGTFRYGLLLAGTLLCTTPGFAADTPETVETRISRLEQELADLKALVKSKPAVTVQKAEPPAEASVSTGAGTKVQFYGFARFDASYDSGQIYTGNIALWAQPKNGSSSDSEWNLTAGATRLGMNLSGPDTEDIKLTGNIEFDFLSSNSTSENNQLPRLRHGYLKAYWPASDFSIIAGQTWDVISSQIPFVDDPAIMWAAGNIGSRHAQLRLTKGFAAGEKSRIEVAVAASRTIGENNAGVLATDPGKDAAMPTIQGRVALSTPIFAKNYPATFAVSGHFGQEEWDSNNTGTHKTLDSWSCNAEASMPLCPKFTLAGEYFTGTNLDDYMGGIGQGVNKSTPKEIRSHGGWAALRYVMNPSTSFSIGAGMDNPNDADLPVQTSPLTVRTLNQTIFANVINKITPNFILGLQLGEWRTEYKNAATSNALRAQSSMTYKF